MSVDANKQIIDRLYEEFFGRGDMDTGDELLADNFVTHAPLPAANKEEFKMMVSGILQAFPDVAPVVEDMVAEGDRVSVRVRATGTHRGEFMGIPATGQKIAWRELHIYRFADGQIAEHWAELSQLEMLQQLGAIPAPGQPES